MNLLNHKDELKSALKKEFNLDVTDILEFKGTYKKSFKVKADKDYFLKFLSFVPNDGDKLKLFLDNMVKFRDELEGQDINVLSPLKTKEEIYYFLFEGFVFELYESLGDVLPNASESELVDLMIKIHKLPKIGDYSNHPRNSLADIKTVRSLSLFEKCIAILDFLEQYELGSEKYMIHRDLHTGNILAVDGKQLLVDFELVSYGSNAYDIGRYLISKGVFIKDNNLKMVENFLSAYCEKIRLSSKDISAIIGFMILVTCVNIKTAKRIRLPDLDNFLSAEYENLNYLVDNFGSLEDSFRIAAGIEKNSEKAEISVGNKCNNNCIVCSNDNAIVEKRTESVKSEILNAKLSGLDKLILTGGEPTIRKDFFELLKYARSIGMKTELKTNGRAFFYKTFAARVCEVGIDSFLVTLHAHTPELYSKICRSDGYIQAIQGIHNLKSLGQDVSILCNLSDHNKAHLREIMEHHSELEPTTIQIDKSINQ